MPRKKGAAPLTDTEAFGAFGARRITLNRAGIRLSVTDWGAAVLGLLVPDRTGALRDVVLGYRLPESYRLNPEAHGATVGRFANRIGGARFCLGGTEYLLDKNEGNNTLHGGFDGYAKRRWRMEALGEHAVTFALTSPHGDQKMPGTAELTVTYRLGDDRSLSIAYHALCDRDTVMSLTNHSYFNLNGHAAGSVAAHILRLRSAAFTPIDREGIPTGEIRPVRGTAFDFTAPKALGRDWDGDDEQLAFAQGYDHNFVLEPADSAHPFAEAWSEESGIVLRAFTDRPGVQLYTGNHLPSALPGKSGAPYRRRGGFCLETQAFPDAPNKPGFPGAGLSAGVPFVSATRYQFGTLL